jgi:hypothetical protein
MWKPARSLFQGIVVTENEYVSRSDAEGIIKLILLDMDHETLAQSYLSFLSYHSTRYELNRLIQDYVSIGSEDSFDSKDDVGELI